jgi:hypothetical protein
VPFASGRVCSIPPPTAEETRKLGKRSAMTREQQKAFLRHASSSCACPPARSFALRVAPVCSECSHPVIMPSVVGRDPVCHSADIRHRLLISVCISSRIRRYWVGNAAICLGYMFLTSLRDFRDNFQARHCCTV